MTLKLTRSLWLWAGALTLALLAIVPLSTGLRTLAVLAVACLVILAWIKTGMAQRRQRLQWLSTAAGVLHLSREIHVRDPLWSGATGSSNGHYVV